MIDSLIKALDQGAIAVIKTLAGRFDIVRRLEFAVETDEVG